MVGCTKVMAASRAHKTLYPNYSNNPNRTQTSESEPNPLLIFATLSWEQWALSNVTPRDQVPRCHRTLKMRFKRWRSWRHCIDQANTPAKGFRLLREDRRTVVTTSTRLLKELVLRGWLVFVIRLEVLYHGKRLLCVGVIRIELQGSPEFLFAIL
jgi:hypothetical protein